LQLPTKDNGNFAIVKATVVSKVGESFTDIGDANPTNCNAKVGKHLLRLASTRAIARALRSFTNVGLTALEELADLNDVLGNGEQKPRTAAKKKATPKAKASPSAKKSGKAGDRLRGPREVAPGFCKNFRFFPNKLVLPYLG
jgi:hypothetical protein